MRTWMFRRGVLVNLVFVGCCVCGDISSAPKRRDERKWRDPKAELPVSNGVLYVFQYSYWEFSIECFFFQVKRNKTCFNLINKPLAVGRAVSGTATCTVWYLFIVSFSRSDATPR